MRKLFTLFLGLMFVSGVFAQKPEGIFKKASVAPVLDGQIDEVWAEAEQYFIDKNFQAEVPTLSTVNPQTETYWKGLWTDEGVYVLLNVMDDAYYPNYVAGGGNDYDYDKTEIYFDVNSFNLEDGLGCSGGANGNQGHYQFAPSFTATNVDGTLMEVDGYKYAILVEEPNYVQEYFIPFSKFVQKEGMGIDMTGNIGFDVTIIDREVGDAARKRSVWANIGGTTESWANMDDCGIITFDGVGEIVDVSSITLENGVITEDNQTFQVVATVLPENATNKNLMWSVATKEGSTGRATISSTGVVSPITDGTVIVTAKAMDASYEEATCEVVISGQKPTIFELSYIKNGDFSELNATGGAKEWSVPASGAVVEGVLEFGPDSVLTNQWDYSVLQRTYVPFELKDMNFILSFKAWADEPRTLPLIFEDAYNDGAQWDAYATSTDAGWSDKTWTVNLTTEPTVYTLNLNFSPMKETTQQNMNFQVGKETPRIYLDSMYLISEADMELVYTAVPRNDLGSFKVYPNPVDTKLHVTLSTAGEKVAIYNSLGIKLEEVVVPGTHHVFDVSRYSRGLYFVKSKDTVVKFVK